MLPLVWRRQRGFFSEIRLVPRRRSDQARFWKDSISSSPAEPWKMFNFTSSLHQSTCSASILCRVSFLEMTEPRCLLIGPVVALWRISQLPIHHLLSPPFPTLRCSISTVKSGMTRGSKRLASLCAPSTTSRPYFSRCSSSSQGSQSHVDLPCRRLKMEFQCSANFAERRGPGFYLQHLPLVPKPIDIATAAGPLPRHGVGHGSSNTGPDLAPGCDRTDPVLSAVRRRCRLGW